MAMKKVCVVTGANKGIGYAICQKLLTDSECKGSFLVYLGSRNAERGQAAREKLIAAGAASEDVKCLVLDVCNQESVTLAAQTVQTESKGVDILINNAGIAYKGDAFDEEVARNTLGTNYFGALRVSETFFPLLNENARVVNVSSRMGNRAFAGLSQERKDKFLDSKLSIDQLSGYANEFITDVADNTYASKGWPKQAYGVSKVLMGAMTRVHARDMKTPGVVVNAICPGWVRTDMGGSRAMKSIEEGADTPVWAALLPVNTAINGMMLAERNDIGYT